MACTFHQMNQNLGPNCSDTSWQRQTIKKAVDRCRETIASALCQEYFKSAPDLLQFQKKCTEQSVCEETRGKDFDLKNCGKGYWDGFTEQLSDLTDAVKDTVQKKVSSVKKNIENYNQQIRANKENIQEYKQELFDILTQQENVPQEVARSLVENTNPALILLRLQKYKLQKAKEARLVEGLKNSSEQAVGSESSSARLTGEKMRADSAALFNAIAGPSQCLDFKAQIQMYCKGGSYVADPLLVVGAAAKAPRIAHRIFHTVQKTALVPMPSLPASMAVKEVLFSTGETARIFERAVKMPDGSTKIYSRELPIDKLTGTIDANFTPGKEFLENIIKDKNGKVTLAVIDLDNLGFVSKKFTHGAQGSAEELKKIAFQNGDVYIQKVVQEIQNVVGDKGILFRSGGDEFQLVLNETDPDKVKAILERINLQVRSPEVRKIFSEEAKARARDYRALTQSRAANGTILSTEKELQAAGYLKDYVPYSQPNVSMGAVVPNGMPLQKAIEVAEEELKQGKITYKNSLGADTSKYGGTKPKPGQKPKTAIAPPSKLPIQGPVSPGAKDIAPNLTGNLQQVGEQRFQEKFRFGNMSVVNYKSGHEGKDILMLERYSGSDGARSAEVREIFTNTRTGFIDGRHERGEELLNAFINSNKTPKRGFVWVNAENLGLMNYFKAGSATGDKLLQATAKVIRKKSNSNSLPIKMQGSEFIIASEGFSAKDLANFSQSLERSLQRDPVIQKIYTDQAKYLEAELKRVRAARNLEAESAVKESIQKLEDAKKMLFSVHGTSVNHGDSLSSVMGRTRALRYTE